MTQSRVSNLADVIKERRTIYRVSNSPTVDRQRIEKAIELALHAPSAFNMQSGRLAVLTGNHHQQLWDIVREVLRPHVPPENFGQTEEKLQGFRNGAATILFFEDQAIVKGWQEKAPTYKDKFPGWSQQNSAMLQYALWLALTADGLGASLQHYNPLIDDQVREKWGIPAEWELNAQMPLGNPEIHPDPPEHLPINEVVTWH